MGVGMAICIGPLMLMEQKNILLAIAGFAVAVASAVYMLVAQKKILVKKTVKHSQAGAK